LIADDILQGRYIAKSRHAVERRQRTIHKRLRNFLWEITHNPILETCLLPVGDGIALCYKKEEYDPSRKGEYDYEY
ncbi:MAG: O-methyltransferase, partial [Lachnospiraceae bacterium]|nr:O-methyltransferase [Lachnospiraceae bacterium]